MFVMFNLVLLVLAASASAEEMKKSRHPKLFLISSSTTTTTISTTTLCWSSNTAVTTCKKKKRRYISEIPEIAESGLMIDPKAVESEPEDEVENENYKDLVKSGQSEYEREGKFLLYWKTTTSTSTSYTATTTLQALECTPSGFGLSECGKK